MEFSIVRIRISGVKRLCMSVSVRDFFVGIWVEIGVLFGFVSVMKMM